MRKKPTQDWGVQKAAVPTTATWQHLENDCFDSSGLHICALCRTVAFSAEEHEWHFQSAHSGWVDQLVIAMCLAEAS